MLSAQNISRPRPGGTAHVSPEGIIYCTDGKFRWVYEFDQRKRPTILLSLLWKFMAAGAAAGLLFLLLHTDRLLHSLGVLLGLTAAGALAALVPFALHILRNGPCLCLLFTADGSTVSCQQVKGKTTGEKVAHAIAAWVGGQSQPALRFHDARVCRFDSVRTIHPNPAHDLIRVNGLKVYARPEQFPLVLDYLKRQCPGAK